MATTRTLHQTGTGAIKLTKPDHIFITPYGDDGKLGKDTYDLQDVVRDTTSISQDDNDTTDIERETSDTPILSIVTTGKYQFAAEVADTQADVLKALCGFKVDTAGNLMVAPSTYKTMYAEVAVVFGDDATAAKNTALILPKLQLNSKTTIESLNSNLAKVALAGTAQLGSVTVDSKSILTPFYFNKAYALPKTGDTISE